MSWLTSFENILNKVDQAAGQALHKEGGWVEENSQSGISGGTTGSLTSHALLSNNSSKTGRTSENSANSGRNFDTGNSSRSSFYPSDSKQEDGKASMTKSPSFSKAPTESSTSRRAGTPADEELFEFLNSPSTSGNSRSESRTGSRTKTSEEISRPPSTSSTSRTPGRTTPADSGVSDLGSRHDDETVHGESSLTADEGGVSVGGPTSQLGGGLDDRKRRELERENELLRSEITSLNVEMSSVVQRIRNLQDELQQSQQKLQNQSRQLSHSEQIARELRSRENDLQESLTVKDTQLSVLRSKLEDADKEIKLKEKKVAELYRERDRILEDQSSSTGVQGQALDTLQEKLRESEANLRREQEHYQTAKLEWQDREKKLESDKQDLATELSTLQRNLNREKAQNSDMAGQLKTCRSQMESAKQDLQEYKDKAARILQSKDRLIASLKEGGGEGSESAGSGTNLGVLTSELEATKQERDVLREELQSVQISLDNLRAELNEAETQLQQEAESNREAVSSLEDQISVEKRKREDLELENNRQKQELRYVHEELLKQKNALQSRIQDREDEINRLRNQLTTKAVSGSNEQELEARLHQLTESLIHKQTVIEALSTDKSSLLLQLERLEKQYVSSEAAATRASSSTVNIPEDDEVRQRGQGFMAESPFDGGFQRKVKYAANTIDRFSMRLGRFLRQYPIARVFIIIYMVILHLWVMIVLLTYQPEMHQDSYQPNEPKS